MEQGMWCLCAAGTGNFIEVMAMRLGASIDELRHGIRGEVYLTGGLCDSPYFVEVLSAK